MWETEREGPDEVFQMTREIVAVEGDTAVARLEVRYGDPVDQEYRDLWIMRFAEDGRCRSFEEWRLLLFFDCSSVVRTRDDRPRDQ